MATVSTGPWAQGNVASASTDSGYPVKVGGVRTAAPHPTLAVGQRGDIQLSTHGALAVFLHADVGTASDGLANVWAYFDSDDETTSTGPPVFNLGFNGATWDRLRTPAVFKQVSGITAAGNTAVWTPTTGKKFRLMGYAIYLSLQAKAAAAADLVVTFQDSTTDLGIVFMSFVPGALTAGEVLGTSGAVQLGNGRLSALANNALNVNLSFALTGGSVAVSVWGTEE